MLVVVTAGHSNTDPGAVRYEGNVVVQKESDFCADMRNYVAYYLRNWGVSVKTDGDGRTNAPLQQAITLAKTADIAIEFHLNAASTRRVRGVEVLARDKHKVLSQQIAQAISGITGSPLRGDLGWRPEDAGQHKRLGFVSAGGLIVELEFVSNPTAMQDLTNKRWVVAKAIAEVIFNFINNED